MRDLKVLAIIITYNAMKWVDRCFSSLMSSSIRPDVFVVDNGSTDGTQDYVETHFPDVIFVQSEKNLGFGKANNLGMRYAIDNDYDYVYLLNQDAWLLNDTLEKMVESHLKYPEYGVLSPIQIQANMDHIDTNFLKRLCYNAKTIIEPLIWEGKKQILDIDMTMAAHWLISRKCLEAVGAFSPAFPHYCEDDNYADRVVFHGLKNGVVVNALAVHDRENRKKTNRQKIYDNYINTIMYVSFLVKKHPHARLSFYYHCLKDAIVYRSFLPFSYMYKLTKDYNSIIKYKELSKQRGAFL